MEIRPVRTELFHADGRTDGRTDRQTDRNDEANSRSLQFCERENECVVGSKIHSFFL